MREYIVNLWIQSWLWIDQGFNVIFGGSADETLSCRAFRFYMDNKTNWAYLIINKLFFWQDNHCYKAFLNEKDRKHHSRGFRGFLLRWDRGEYKDLERGL